MKVSLNYNFPVKLDDAIRPPLSNQKCILLKHSSLIFHVRLCSEKLKTHMTHAIKKEASTTLKTIYTHVNILSH